MDGDESWFTFKACQSGLKRLKAIFNPTFNISRVFKSIMYGFDCGG